VIKAKNTGDRVAHVTSGDIAVLDETGRELPARERDALFPRSAVSGGHVLLAVLKPGAEPPHGEELHVEWRARKGCGREHACFKLTSECYFRNVVDEELSRRMLDLKLAERKQQSSADGLSPELEARLRSDHAALDAQRAFRRREGTEEPAQCEFVVKTETCARPTYVVRAGFDVMSRLLDAVERGLLAARRTAEQLDAPEPRDGGRHNALPPLAVTVAKATPSVHEHDLYDVHLSPADDTIGNLLQGLLYRHWIVEGASRDVSYVGYTMPHPNEDAILLKLRCARPKDDVYARLLEGVRWAAAYVDALADEWRAAEASLPAGSV
jgi:DNA-directed RNA polymerase subunit L